METAQTRAAPKRKGPTAVAREYFAALNARDLDAAAALWEPGRTDRLVGMAELRVPDEFKRWFRSLFDAFPDFEFEVLTVTASKEHAAVRWRAQATFDGTGKFEGMAPNGAKVEMEGSDVLTIRDGRIIENHAYANGAALARQVGLMPPQGSAAERGLLGAFNAKTAAAEALSRLRERRGR